MKTKALWFLAIAGFSLLAVPNVVLAQTWTQTSAPSNYWNAIACSADGKKVVAAGYGSIYTSTNSGTTWTSNNVPYLNWYCVASSADGSRLFAGTVDQTNVPIISTNSGRTWTVPTNAPSPGYWGSLACSGDGSNVAATVMGGHGYAFYTSPDGGLTWKSNSLSNTYVWSSVAYSADGSKLFLASVGMTIGIAGRSSGSIFRSTNSGASWSGANGPEYVGWHSIACSADGVKVIAGGEPAPVLTTPPFYDLLPTSADSGTTWTPHTNFPSIYSVATSADGSRLIAAGKNVYTSSDSGMTWTTADLPAVDSIYHDQLYHVAASADGCRLWAAGSLLQRIYVSDSVPSPTLELVPSGNNLGISWTIPSRNFVLQQSSDLHSANWTDVAAPPLFNASTLHYQATLTATNTRNCFWRLTNR